MHYRCLWIALGALILGFACTKKTQSSQVVDFNNHYSIETRLDHATSTLNVEVKMDSAIHAYAEGEKIGRPVKLEIAPKNGWRSEGSTTLPKGEKKQLEIGESVVIKGPFTIKQKVAGGSGPGEATLYLQVCSDTACDQPRAHPLIFNP